MTLLAFVGTWDYANLCNRIARALDRYRGTLRARVITAQRHPFGYEEDIVLEAGAGELAAARAVVREAEWICHSGDGDYPGYFALLEALGCHYGNTRKRWATTHAGSAFRSDSESYERPDLVCERRFLAMDNIRFAFGDPRARPYVAPMGDYAWPLAPARPNSPLAVCHSPSRRTAKGTDRILRAMPDFVRLDVVEGVPAGEAFRRRAACDVYIDQDNPDNGGFGAAALEALCQGVACIANVSHIGPVARSWIPMPPIAPLSPRYTLPYWLTVFTERPGELAALRELGLAWCRRHVSDAGIAAYWHEALGCA
jgi:hypothetical protein